MLIPLLEKMHVHIFNQALYIVQSLQIKRVEIRNRQQEIELEAEGDYSFLGYNVKRDEQLRVGGMAGQRVGGRRLEGFSGG